MVWNRIRFPNMSVVYMGKTGRVRDNQYIFRVDPSYTKHDIKEYLSKIYNLPVAKVNTMNYEGKFKRVYRGKHVYKQNDYKKAIVTLKTDEQ